MLRGAGSAPVGPGDVLGQYVLGAPLGRGGEATVYRAARSDRPGEAFAVKVFHESARVGNAIAEGRTLARLQHPGVLEVHTVGQIGGVVFVAVDFAPGGTLRERVRRSGTLPGAQIGALFRPMAAALATAHALGIVHRDIHPRNILVDAAGGLRLADFGLAATLASGGVPGGVVGTPAFIAPEVWAGSGATAASDTYALGACLHFAASGRDLVDALGDVAEMRRRHLDGQLEFDAELDPRLSSLIRRMVGRDPATRPAMDRVAAALDRLTASDGGDGRTGASPLRAFGARLEAVDRIQRLGHQVGGPLFIHRRPVVLVGPPDPWRRALVELLRGRVAGEVAEVVVRDDRSMAHASLLLRSGRHAAVFARVDGNPSRLLILRWRTLAAELHALPLLMITDEPRAAAAAQCASIDGHPPRVVRMTAPDLHDAWQLTRQVRDRLDARGTTLTADAALLLAEHCLDARSDPGEVIARALDIRQRTAAPVLGTWCVVAAERVIHDRQPLGLPGAVPWPDGPTRARLDRLKARLDTHAQEFDR